MALRPTPQEQGARSKEHELHRLHLAYPISRKVLREARRCARKSPAIAVVMKRLQGPAVCPWPRTRGRIDDHRLEVGGRDRAAVAGPNR